MFEKNNIVNNMTVHFNFYEKLHLRKAGGLYVDFVMIYCMYDIQLTRFLHLPLCERYAVTVGIVFLLSIFNKTQIQILFIHILTYPLCLLNDHLFNHF